MRRFFAAIGDLAGSRKTDAILLPGEQFMKENKIKK